MEKFDENQDKNINYDEFNKMMINFHDYFGQKTSVSEQQEQEQEQE